MTTTLMPTTAEGAAMSDLAAIIASCGAFQEAARVEDSEALAADFVHYPLQPDFVPNKFPFATLTSTEYEEERLAGNTYLPRGTIRVIIGRLIENMADHKVAELEFTNFSGAIIRAITDVSGEGGHYVWTPQQIAPPARTDPRDVAGYPPYYEVMYDCQWSSL